MVGKWGGWWYGGGMKDDVVENGDGKAAVAKAPRQSNFELLRLLAMLAIVAGHLFTEGLLISRATPGTLLPSLLLGCGARIATNVFVLLGCWFLADATRPGAPVFAPGRRWLRIHFTVFCWTAPLTVAAVAMGAHPGGGDVVRGFLPFFGRPLWFASAWMTLLLFVPFLRHAMELEERRLDALVGVGTVFFVVQSTVADFRVGYLTDTLWFMYVYVFAGWLRLRWERWAERIPAWGALGAAVGIYAAMVLPEWWARANWGTAPAARTVHAVAAWYLAELKCAPNFLCALAWFLFFARLRLPVIPAVNAAARPAFAVYVAHQTPVFWPLLWDRILLCPDWRGESWTPWVAVGVTVGLYAAIGIVEMARQRWVERWVLGSRGARWVCSMLDRMLRAQ